VFSYYDFGAFGAISPSIIQCTQLFDETSRIAMRQKNLACDCFKETCDETGDLEHAWPVGAQIREVSDDVRLGE
jgi:hypothetical protein